MTLPSLTEFRNRCPTRRTAAEPLRPDTGGLRPELPALRPELETLRLELPDPLRSELDRLGKRATPEELERVIVRLAACRALSLDELSGLTGRTADHLQKYVAAEGPRP